MLSTCKRFIGAAIVVFAGQSLLANLVEVVRPEFLNELKVGVVNLPAEQSSSAATYSGNVDTTDSAPSGTIPGVGTVKLQESSFGQALATDVPYRGFELDSILRAQAVLYPATNLNNRVEVEASGAVFRYKFLLFNTNAGTVAVDPDKMTLWFGATERAKFNDAVKLMRDALKYAPYDRTLRNTLLDAYYDRAVAEAQFVKLDLARIARYRLGLLALAPSEFVINKEIEIATNLLARYEDAFRGYGEMLKDRMGVDVKEYDPNAVAGLPMGTFIFQQEQPFRNQYAAQWVDDAGVIRTVPRYDPALGTNVVDPDRVMFAAYKDYVMLTGLLRDYARSAADLVPLFGMRGLKTPTQDDVQAAYNLIAKVQRETQMQVLWLRSMFPAFDPGPGDASGFQAALNGLGVGLADLDSFRAFLDGKANLLGFDPNFLVLIKEAPDGTERFDSYDALMYWIGARPPMSDFTPLGYARTAYNEAKASYENYKGKADQVWDQLDTIAGTYDDRYYEITGWDPGDTTTSHILAPKPGSELWQANQNIALSDKRVASMRAQSANLAGTITTANEVVTLASTKSDRLDTAKTDYFNTTTPTWDNLADYAANMAASQAAYDTITAIASIDGITTILGAGLNIAAIGLSGAANTVIQTVNSHKTKTAERDLERAAADYDVAQMKLDIPTEIAQAGMEYQDRLREQTALALEMDDATTTQGQEVARRALLIRELERIKQQAEESDANLADRYYADPIHYLRAQNDMILADQAFRDAQRWTFFTLRALEFKWNKDFVISWLSKDWQLSSIFKLRNYTELAQLVGAMEEFNRVNLLGFNREPFLDVISLRNDILAPAAGKGQDDLWLDVETGDRVTSTNLFRRKLQRMVDGEGHLLLNLNTFAFKKDSGFFFLGPRYRTNGTVLSAGKYLDKIDWIKFNVVGSHTPVVRDANLSYGGTCYLRTRVPPCGDPDNPFELAGEYRVFPFYYFRTLDNGVTWQTRKVQEDTVKMAFTQASGEPEPDLQYPNSLLKNLFLKERSVAATSWVLTLPKGTFNLNQMEDIEIYVRHLFVSREIPDCN
jgi:hypothetical protein